MFPPLVPVAQQHPAWEEALVLSDAHSCETRGGDVWHLRGPGILQWREGPQWHHTGYITHYIYITLPGLNRSTTKSIANLCYFLPTTIQYTLARLIMTYLHVSLTCASSDLVGADECAVVP